MARTTAAGAAAKTARATASKASVSPARSAAKTTAKTAGTAKAAAVKSAASARKPAAPKTSATAAKKPATAKSAATPAAKAARAAAKAVAKPAAKAAAKPAAKARAGRDAGIVRPEAATQARPTLVRDSFTMPEQEYAVLGAVKQACLKAGFEVKKSELLRIGVALLGQLDVTSLRAVLSGLPQLKTGRPPGE
ncbi:hypothetical protein AB4Z32_17795 [Massilia sp. 2TAF26]|uniref:hypothetical protein n=1 Tax=Massilia sp. 2TAF26 TaxID=3233012 RepID=UPI003F9B6D3F